MILDAFEKLADYSELLGDAVSAEKYRNMRPQCERVSSLICTTKSGAAL